MAKASPRAYDDDLATTTESPKGRRHLLRDVILPGLLAFQLLLYFFWQVTQFEAVSGTWYQALFNKSGPVLLPIMFGVELLLFALAAPVAWQERQLIRRNLPSVLLMIAVGAGLLTIPLAYVDHFDKVKIWKDVAFLLGFLTAPLVLLLRRRTVRILFFYFLALALVDGVALLFEAIHRAVLVGQTPGQFLFSTYRIYGGGGQLAEVLLLFAVVAMLGSYPRRFKRVSFAILLVLCVYAFLRQRLDYTRLSWISLAIAIPIIVLLLLPQRARKSGLLLTGGMLALFALMTPVIAAVANGTDLSSRFTSSQDVSVVYRVKESQLLLHQVVRRPLTGWGPGGTISPHVKSEPTRNNTSSFFNGYLGIPYKFGLLVLGLMVGGVLAGIFVVWRGLKITDLAPLDAAAAAGAAAYLVAVLTTSAASDILFANFSGLPVGLMIGIGSRLVRQEPVVVDATRS